MKSCMEVFLQSELEFLNSSSKKVRMPFEADKGHETFDSLPFIGKKGHKLKEEKGRGIISDWIAYLCRMAAAAVVF